MAYWQCVALDGMNLASFGIAVGVAVLIERQSLRKVSDDRQSRSTVIGLVGIIFVLTWIVCLAVEVRLLSGVKMLRQWQHICEDVD